LDYGEQSIAGSQVEGAQNEYRLAWMWAEGWRARLRKAGDAVERERYGR